MMLEERFPIGLQVGLYGVIANNSTKFAKANFEGIPSSPDNLSPSIHGYSQSRIKTSS
jgi:hypothetical protein